ncbi:MAG: flagellar basal body P-ring formation chaperone FlgA [Pirellulales bacterium]
MKNILLTTVILFSISATVNATEIVLRQQATISHSIVRLGDIADLNSPSLRWTEEMKQVDLLPAPAHGEGSYLTVNEVRSMLSARGVDTKRLRFSGASRVKIFHSREFTIPTRSGFARPVNYLETMPRSPRDPQPKHMAVFPVRPIRRGEIIMAQDLTLRPLNVVQNPSDYLTSIAEVAGKEASRSLSSGRPVLNQSPREPIQIQRNQPVTVYARIGSLVVRRESIALEEGSQGEVIKVQTVGLQNQGRSNRGDILQVIITGPGEAEVMNRAATSSRPQQTAGR